jgi:hypothetical protein
VFLKYNPTSSMHFPKMISINHFLYSFAGLTKGTFFKISLSLFRALGITPDLHPVFGQRLLVWKQHVDYFTCLSRHVLWEDDLLVLILGEVNFYLRRGQILLYGSQYYTINSHKSTHIGHCIIWGVLPKGNQTNVWEGIIGIAKRTIRDNTGSVSVVWSCVRVMLLRRLLLMLLRPASAVPVREGVIGKPILYRNTDFLAEVFSTGIINYSETRAGSRVCSEDTFGDVIFFFYLNSDLVVRLKQYTVVGIAEFSGALLISKTDKTTDVLVSSIVGSFVVMPYTADGSVLEVAHIEK